MTQTNQRIVLASRPTGEPTVDNFRLEEKTLPELQDGQVLVQHHFMSLDPYMRGRMNDAKSYAQPQALDEVMGGGTVGEVVASKNPAFAVGDKVVGMGGWQQYAIVDATQRGVLQKVDTTHVPLSAYLGPVGMPGATAWYGLTKIIEPKQGETVVVSAASGAVGTVVGQLAKARGCRAVGIAGGKEKCDYVVKELGFDACIDYKAHPDVKSMSAGAEGSLPERHRRLLRERRRLHPRRRAAAHERLRPHRDVRDDLRLQRPADPDGGTAADPGQSPEGAGLHRQRAHGGLARGAEGDRHDGRHAASSSTARRSRKA